MKKPLDSSGSIMVEGIIALMILLIAVTAMIPLFVLSSKSTSNNKISTIAYNVAAEELERIKSIPYDSIGIVGGNPSGVLDNTTTKNIQNIPFKIKTSVKWIDDPSDGLIPTDQDGRDYKKVTVTVSWKGTFGEKSLSLHTFVARQSEDAAALGGNIKVSVKDSSGKPLENVKINIDSGPSAPLADYTDENGEVVFYTLTPSQQENDYQLSALKSGYIAQPGLNPQKVTVNQLQTTNIEFIMERPGNLNVQLVSSSDELIEKDSKLVLKHPFAGTLIKVHYNGNFQINDLYPGFWEITPYATSYETTQPVSIEIKSDKLSSLVIKLAEKPKCLIQIEVIDASSNDKINGATINLKNLETNASVTDQTNPQGVSELQIEAGSYTILVTKTGYNDYSNQINVSPSENSNISIALNKYVLPGSILVRTQRTNGNTRNNVRIRVVGNNYYQEQLTGTGSNADGEAIFNNIMPGNYTVERLNGSKWIDVRTITVLENQQSVCNYVY